MEIPDIKGLFAVVNSVQINEVLFTQKAHLHQAASVGQCG